MVDVAAPAGTAVDLFAEGPTPEWALPVPTPVDGAPAGLQRFAFELDGAPPGRRYQGALVTLTAVAGGWRDRGRRSVSTNSPGTLIWCPACLRPELASAGGSSKINVQP